MNKQGVNGDVSFGAKMELIQTVEQTRWILIMRPGSRVDETIVQMM